MNRNRVGFTLVELLVVITIIGILMGLLIPAVNAARETARRNQCNTQLKNFALAAIQYENSKGQLPGYVNDFGTFPGTGAATGPDPSDPGNYAGAVPAHKKIGTWAVALLPWLEAQPTYEHWTEDRYPIISNGAGTYPATTDESGTNFHQLAAPNLPIFQCPSNPVASGDQGLNSYASNNGLAHLTAGLSPGTVIAAGFTFADSQDRANGPFNCKYNVTGTAPALTRGSEGPAVRLDDFKDGQGNTILFSENVQAFPWHRAGLISDTALVLADPAVDTDVAFSIESARYINGMVWHYEDPQATDAAMATLWNQLGTGMPVVPAEVFSKHKINGGGATVNDDIFNADITDTNSARDLARPSSAHVDGVNTGMADGGTRFIQESIDYRVYQALMNLRGKSSDVPWPEFILTDEVL